MRRAKKFKDCTPRGQAAEASAEGKAVMGYSPRQHQDVVPRYGQGPYGNVAAQVPYGTSPPVADPPVGAGKGFKGWR